MLFSEYIRERLLHGNNNKDIALFSKWNDHYDDVILISERIKNDVKKIEDNTKEGLKLLKKNKKAAGKLLKETLDYIGKLRLDLESFFLFVRALMDDICKIIKRLAGNAGNQLPPSLAKLLKGHLKYKGINVKFFNGLNKELSWFMRFKDKRDNLLHQLHDIFLIDDSRGLSFDVGEEGNVRGAKETTENIIKYVDDILKKINHLQDIFLTKNINELLINNRV